MSFKFEGDCFFYLLSIANTILPLGCTQISYNCSRKKRYSNIDLPEIYKYQVDRNTPLPASVGEEQKVDVDNREHKEDYTSTKENESNEEFYKYYHGPKDELSQIQSKGKSRQLFDLHTLLTQRQDRLWQA